MQLPTTFLAALARHRQAGGAGESTLADAIVHLAEERKLDGLPDTSIRSTYGWPGAAVLDRLPAGIRVDELTFEVVRDLAIKLREHPYSSRTVRDKHLALIRMCLVERGCEDVVRAVTRRLRKVLALDIPEVEVFSAAEVAALADRIMDFTGQKQLRSRRKHLAILRFAWLRGVRCLEFGRVRVEDFDYRGRTLAVREAKSPTRPRVVPLCTQLLDDARVLVEGRSTGLLVDGGARAIRHATQVWQKRLQEPRLQYRVLRQSAATILAEQGATEAEIAQFLGHAHGSRHTRRYVIARESRMKAHLEALDWKLLGPKVDPDTIAAALPRRVS